MLKLYFYEKKYPKSKTLSSFLLLWGERIIQSLYRTSYFCAGIRFEKLPTNSWISTNGYVCDWVLYVFVAKLSLMDGKSIIVSCNPLHPLSFLHSTMAFVDTCENYSPLTIKIKPSFIPPTFV